MVPGDDPIDVRQAGQGLLQRLGHRHTTPAIAAVDEWRILPREHVARVQNPERGKDDEGVAIRVARAEVVQVDLVLPGPERRRVRERALRQELRLVAGELIHPNHVGLRVLVNDRVDRRAEELIAAHMVAVRVRVDDGRDRLVGHGADLLEQPLTPSGQLRVDDDHTRLGHEDRRVATRERRPIVRARRADDVEVVLDLLNVEDVGPLEFGRTRCPDRQASGQHQHTQYKQSPHVVSPCAFYVLRFPFYVLRSVFVAGSHLSRQSRRDRTKTERRTSNVERKTETVASPCPARTGD